MYKVTTISRNDFDLRDSEALSSWFSKQPYFDVVIHTAIDGGSRMKQDDNSVIDNNLKMYYNLVKNQDRYGKLINIGSGAELYAAHTPYGHSKHIIRQSVLTKEQFYNVRVFAVFDENELETRFIKANVLRYIDKQPMVIHQDKKMDFFYMRDFIEVIKYYINSNSPPKEFDCRYDKSYYLSDIAGKINKLSDYKVDVIFTNESFALDYVGVYTPIDVSFSGLDAGIQTSYNKLCKI
jgi:nucleoside-diphosphate-sugar epimerase